MKKLVTVLNIILAVYFFILANLFFWGYFLSLLAGAFKGKGAPEIFWHSIIEMILAPFLIYGSIMFFRKTKAKYLYGLVMLGIILIETLVYRLLYITHGKLEETDLSNILFFGIPFVIVLFAQYLDKKFSEGVTINKYYIVFLIVTTSIVLIAGGILGWQYFEAPEGGIKEEATEDETANWKVYQDEEYGFKIKYPNDWNYHTGGGLGVITFYQGEWRGEGDILLRVIEGSLEEEYQRIKQILENRNTCFLEKCSIEQFYKTPNECKGKCELRESIISITGEEGKAILTENNPLGFSKEVFVEGGKGKKLGWFLHLTSTFRHEAILDQMLSTFRFLE